MKIEDLLNSEDELVSKAASLVTEAKMAFDKSEIDQDQLNEIVNDATELKTIDELTDDLDRKVMVEKAYMFLKEFGGVIL